MRVGRAGGAFVGLLLMLLVGAGCSSGKQVRRETPPAQPGQPWRAGMASWYGKELAGRLTANGERFNPARLTAAHRTLRFGTCVAVENLENGRRVEVRINDRGPYAKSRIIDVSEAAARRLGMRDSGVARVRLSPCEGQSRV